MRTLPITAVLVLAGIGLVTAAARGTQEHAQETDPAQLAEAMELAQPGPEHELLAEHVGEWTVEATLTMMPGAPEVTEKGRARMHTILGGRFP